MARNLIYFFTKIRSKVRMSPLTTAFQHCTKVLDNEIRQKKKKKVGKEDINCPCSQLTLLSMQKI